MVKVSRCAWCGEDPLYLTYHDEEWGVPVAEPRVLFERLMLEGMQAGLSWITILRKREHMRERFFGFDPERLARCDDKAIESWLADAGVIRHRGKLQALVSNARAFLDLEGAFSDSVWSFVDNAPLQNRWESSQEVPSSTPTSEALSKWLRNSGFRFVGPTICYAFMQSAGLVNDHVQGCYRLRECADMGIAWNV